MAFLEYAPTIFSTLFRLNTYVFLRIAPHRLGVTIVPTLFVLYVTSVFFASNKSAGTEKKTTKSEEKKPLLEDSKQTNGTISQSKPAETSSADAYGYPLLTLLWTLPTPSRTIRLANVAINVLLLAASVDFVTNPFTNDASEVVFSRIGAVYHDSAKVMVRYPAAQENASEPLTNHEVRVMWRERDHSSNGKALSDVWKNGPVLTLDSENDWVASAKISGLWPSTAYEYRLNSANGTVLPYPASPLQFRTFPDPHLPTGNHFKFVVTSCLTTNFPYVPLGGTRIRGFDLLADYLFPSPSAEAVTEETSDDSASEENNSTEVKVAPAPTEVTADTDFMLFLGDFIYADVPVYVGNDREAYRRLYRRNYKSESARRVYERLPIIHAYDDHEFINNYAGLGEEAEPFVNATNAFNIYNAHANYDSTPKGRNYFDFRHGDTAFFVMDTRRYRSGPPKALANDEEELLEMERTMLGAEQTEAFLNWLARVNGTATFKLVVTSVPFTSLWTYEGQIDTWAAYPLEKAILLDAMQSVPNVILLSGDRHEFAAIEFNGGMNDKNVVREFSTSPLSMFYVPFVRTLNMRSKEVVPKVVRREFVKTAEDGTESVVVEDVLEEVPREKVLKYLPIGNHKWSSFTVDTRTPKMPKLKLEVLIDGHIAHEFEMIGSPVELSKSRAIGNFVKGGIKNLMNQFVNPGRWF